MRSVCLLFALLPFCAAQGALAQEAQKDAQPVVVEQTYWVTPGKEKQFIALHRKTQLARLQVEREAGRALWIRLGEPLLSSGNEQWDFRVTVAWCSLDAALRFTHPPEDGGASKLRQHSIEETLRRGLIDQTTEAIIVEASS